jgi:hypothetical protein
MKPWKLLIPGCNSCRYRCARMTTPWSNDCAINRVLDRQTVHSLFSNQYQHITLSCRPPFSPEKIHRALWDLHWELCCHVSVNCCSTKWNKPTHPKKMTDDKHGMKATASSSPIVHAPFDPSMGEPVLSLSKGEVGVI